MEKLFFFPFFFSLAFGLPSLAAQQAALPFLSLGAA
jgi:hypothetical protein